MPKPEVLERGSIYFIYRPKVEEEEVKGLKEVQRFYMVLSPEGKKIYRLIVVGRQALPDVEGGERSWGFVDKVRRRAEEVADELEEKEYRTKTRGERELPAARPAGEGVYAIARHGDHTHLAYSLELPERPGEVQEAFRIEDEASYIVTIKNPEKPAPPGAGLKGRKKAGFPKRLMQKFDGRRFADADPPDFLDYEGAEMILIGASEEPIKELGLALKPKDETESSADIFKDLKLEREKHPVKPLLKGKWE
ncbi:MAG: hypothetical protein QY316_06305 [Thermodesulfobacteriota bacterium]|nr:MAG: hypothetical protein QY316_06305 [Thermodesulfobacteriota bacterium]